VNWLHSFSSVSRAVISSRSQAVVSRVAMTAAAPAAWADSELGDRVSGQNDLRIEQDHKKQCSPADENELHGL
jgi:hypothetical protein